MRCWTATRRRDARASRDQRQLYLHYQHAPSTKWGSYILSTLVLPRFTRGSNASSRSVTKGHIRSLMHKLFDLAVLWEYLPLERRNPVDIVKIKGVTKREKEAVVVTPEQFREIVPKLPEHVNMIAITSACLGLRVSEVLGLQWTDIDWKHQRSRFAGAPIAAPLTKPRTRHRGQTYRCITIWRMLLVWKHKCETEAERHDRGEKQRCEWLFANPYTGMPYMSPSLQQRWIRSAGEALGIEGLGFHSLRHSYRSWLDSAGVAPGVTKDLMRHSAISTTFNVYGRALSPEKREGNRKVVEMLLPPRQQRLHRQRQLASLYPLAQTVCGETP